MDNKDLKKILQRCLSPYLFMYKNRNYYFCNNELTVVINCQKSNYDNTYYINFGFWVKELHKESAKLTITECDIMGRFNFDIDGKREYSCSLNTMDEKTLEENIYRNVLNFIIPVINNGIEEYFRLFPEAICAAKLSLKEFLNKRR